MHPLQNIPEQEDILFKKYQKASELKGWRSHLVGAAERVAFWSSSILDNGNLDKYVERYRNQNQLQIKWGRLHPSADYLLEAAMNVTKNQLVDSLVNLNNDLLADPDQLANGLRDQNLVIKDLYRLQRTEVHAFIAALALFDFHLPSNEKLRTKTSNRVVKLSKSVFSQIAEGFGLWLLARRWHRIFIQYFEPEKASKFLHRLEVTSQIHNKVIKELTNTFNNEFTHHEFKIEEDPRRPLWEYEKGYYDIDVADAIHMQITCSDIQSCYSALSWVESLGPVQFRLSRSSLFYSEPNGAKRLQVAVRLNNSSQILLTRIGTAEIHKNNEWGLIFRLLTGEVPKPQQQLSSSSKEIVVYNIHGHPTILDIGSTVADYILKNYSETDAQYCIGAFINTNKASLADHLSSDDIVHIEIDRRRIEVPSVDNWHGQHLSEAANKLAVTIKERKQELIEHGRKRFILAIQEFLRNWDFALVEKDIRVVTSIAGIRTKKNRDAFFESIAEGQPVDNSIYQLFLQYYLRGKIVLSDGSHIPYHWREVKLAQCCNPKEKDEVIGTQALGPHDPDSMRYGTIRELVIHRADCRQGPSPQNALSIIWLPKVKGESHRGMQISFLLRDGRGVLGEILDFVYTNTTLSMEYLTADALNFGHEKAQIVLLAIAPTEFEIEEAKDKLQNKYFPNVSFKNIASRDVKLLLNEFTLCPYVLSTDPTLYSDEPLIMIGRTKEASSLKKYIYDPRINQSMVVGYYRTGKTRFLKHFTSTYNLPDHFNLYVSFDGSPRTKSLSEIPHEIFRQLKPQFAKLGLDSSDQRPKNIYKLSEWLNKVAQNNNCKFTLLIDEFSGIDLWIKHGELDSRFFNHFIRFMEETTSSNFVLVFQASQYYQLIDDYSGMLEYFRGRVGEGTIEINPFSQNEISELLNGPVTEYYQVTPDSVDLITAFSGGFPYICTKLGQLLWLNKDTLDEVDKTKLEEIWKHNLEEQEEDWNAILDQMVFKIPIETRDLLKYISNKEVENAKNLWQSYGTLWVPEDDILSHLKTNLSQPYEKAIELLRKLKKSSLLEDKSHSTSSFWRIRSDLLAFKLSNRYYSD